MLQEAVQTAVMPLWANPDLESMSPDVAQRIISILTKCTKGIDKSGPSLSRASVRPVVQPDPAIVQQIVEMGFSSARAEHALRRVCPCYSIGLTHIPNFPGHKTQMLFPPLCPDCASNSLIIWTCLRADTYGAFSAPLFLNLSRKA